MPEIKLKLIIDGKEALVTLDTANDKVNKLDKKMGGDLVGTLKKVGAAFGLAFGARELFNFAKSSVEAFGEQEAAAKKLEVALGRVSVELENYASELQALSTFADENILEAEAIIAAFIKEEDAIKRITKVAMDFAVVQNMNLVDAAELITKTIASSTNALSRYGIEITGAAGSTQRLDSAVAKLTRLFGGQADAQLETTTGKIKNLKNALSDLQELIGEGLVVAAEGFVDIIQGLDDGISNLFLNMQANAVLQGIIDAATSPTEYIREAVNKAYEEIKDKNEKQIRELIKFREAQIKAMQKLTDPTAEDLNTIEQLKARLDVYKLALTEILSKSKEVKKVTMDWWHIHDSLPDILPFEAESLGDVTFPERAGNVGTPSRRSSGAESGMERMSQTVLDSIDAMKTGMNSFWDEWLVRGSSVEEAWKSMWNSMVSYALKKLSELLAHEFIKLFLDIVGTSVGLPGLGTASTATAAGGEILGKGMHRFGMPPQTVNININAEGMIKGEDIWWSNKLVTQRKKDNEL